MSNLTVKRGSYAWTTKDTAAQTTTWKWYWREEDGVANCGVFHEKREGHAYAVCRCPQYQTRAQWEADATLLTAAHDLLAVCETIASGKGGYMPELRAAIAKAKGEA